MLGAVAVGAVAILGSIEAQLAMLGTWISILAGLVMTQLKKSEDCIATLGRLLPEAGLTSSLVHNSPILQSFMEIAQALSDLAAQSDPVLLEFAEKKLDLVTEQVQSLSRGEVVFTSTESWRTCYEQILRSERIKHYRSVAWFKSPEYWQDGPGQKSLQLNLELCGRGLDIERIVIVSEALWPPGDDLPEPSVLRWIESQFRSGIRISLIREPQLSHEPELCSDFGIYGDRAVGVQDLDDRCRTVRFTLLFDHADVQLAQDQWRRLSLFAQSYEGLKSGSA